MTTVKKSRKSKKVANENQWRDRKIETKRMRVTDIMAHPLNPKFHPDAQNAPLRALLTEVGQLDDLKAYYSARNGGALTFFDGHARQSLDPEQEWNVDIYDLDDAEADLVIATFDPIGYKAQQDTEKLAQLFETINSGQADLQAFLSEMAQQAGIVPPETPTPPDGFVEVSAAITTQYRCPKCHYEWNGQPK